MFTSFHQGIVITIICEAVLQDRLIKLLQTLGASGYTIIPAQGGVILWESPKVMKEG